MAPHTRKQHSVASERRRPTEASVFTAFVNCYSERTLCDILGLGRCIAQVFTESVTLNMALYVFTGMLGSSQHSMVAYFSRMTLYT